MRKIYSLLVLLVTVVLFGSKAYSQISVTATAGTLSQTYTTLGAAITNINNGTHRGVINISVTASTTEGAQIVLNSSGTGSAVYSSILIKPAVGTTPTISSASIAASTALLKLNGADNVTIDGSNTVGGTTRDLTIFNNTATVSSVIWLACVSATDPTTNNVIKNTNITGNASNGVLVYCCSTTYNGQSLGNNTNITIQNNAISGGQLGVQNAGVGTFPYETNWNVTGNNFVVGVYGVYIQIASNFSITNNTITHSGLYQSTAGMAGIRLGVIASNATISGNTITNLNNPNPTATTTGACAGIWLGLASGGTNVNVYNNFISNVTCTFGNATDPNLNGHGIYVQVGNGYNIYYNTVYQNTNQTSGAASSAICLASTMGTANAVDLRDNILVNTQTGGVTTRTAVYCNNSPLVFSTMDYNDYFATSGILASITGSNKTTLASLSTGGFGATTNLNAKNILPTFVSAPSNLRLTNVVGNELLQSGIAISGITTDIDGIVRASVPVMGASEVHVPPVLTYTAVAPSCGTSDITVAGVTITDAIGVANTGSLIPRIYFRKNGGAYSSVAGNYVSGPTTNSIWSFTIPAAVLGGLTAGDVVGYYIVAQNTVGTLVANPSAGFSGTDVNTITTPPTSPNTFTVSAIPTVASITPVTPATCVGTALTLNAGAVTGTGTLTSYNWSGPAGFSTTTTASSTTFTPLSTASTGFYSLTVTYQGDGCTSTVRSAAVTVNPAPPAITGTLAICSGTTTTLHNTTSGGTWSSSVPSVASIGSSSGIVSGISGGNSTISYTVGGVCVVTATLTVNQTPFGIAGSSSVCVGSTTTLSNSLTGGTWISNSPGVASVNTTGDVLGVSAGVATITYTISSTGCFTTKQVTVSPLPSLISGTNTVCVGLTTTLGSTPGGGTWTSDNTAIASTPGTGVITGVAPGTANITYTLATGCIRSIVVSVNQTPAAISGPTSVCSGTTITLTSSPAGGNWTPTTSAIAFVNSTTGVVTGVSSGNSLISYTLPNGCRATYTVAGLVSPPAIGGTLALCAGASTTLTNGVAGGTWSSTDGTVATIGIGTGFVNALAAGTTTISYVAPSGCSRTAVFTVNALPAATTGTFSLCAGTTTTLSNATGTGTWSTSNPSAATVGVSSGVVTGVNAGTANITYRLSTGCLTSNTVSVNALPAAITGANAVCQGLSISLANTTAGGTWTSQNPAVASVVSTTGVVTGTATGTTVQTAVITYTLGTGCYSTKTISVNPAPLAIGGTTALCIGTSSTLTDATTGGTWSTSTPGVATINAGTGLWSAISAGTSTITYKVATGCQITTVVSANILPGNITGVASLCVGATTTLSNSVTGGTWTSMNPAVATISTSGVVSGAAVGTAVISYTLGTGCAKSIIVTVNSLPTTLSGTPVVCEGSTTNFSSTPGGGTWSTSNTAVATAGAISGVITGVSAGTVIVSYNISTGCVSTAVVSVNPLPAPITGASSVCIGSTTPLNTLSTTGTWSSSNVTIATITSAGVVTGVAQGLAYISYTLPTGCARIFAMNVNPLPSVISGPTAVCLGSNINLVSGGGGTWSSSDVTIATVGTTSGIVTGAGLGSATISFIVGTGCYRTHVVTVNETPSPITGTLTVCSGNTTALSSSPAGGVWSPTSSAIASVNASTGVVLGISPGASNISYTLGTGCKATALVTVYTTPGVIGGPTSICEGAVVNMSNSQPGGTWSTGNPVVASITTATGVLTGINAGTATITYHSATGGCYNTTVVTVNPIPLPITGPTNVCSGSATTLSDATPGGIWSTSSTAIAPVGVTTGVVSGGTAGNATITYKLSTGCQVTRAITVDPIPNNIAGVSSACIGSTSALSNTSAGGTWSSANPGTANVDIVGVVTGIASGTTTISYTLSTGCFNTRVFTVYPVPAAIGGVQVVCATQQTTLSDAVPGGVWTSGNVAVATVGSLTGIVTGGSAGIATITYMLSTGCQITTDVTVNAAPSPITGSAIGCVGAVTVLSDASAGTWSSSNNTIATVDATGAVTGVATGTATISYTSSVNGCSALKIFTVQALPAPMTGVPTVCTGLTTALGSTPAGGTWTSSNAGVATVSGSGLVTGVTGGVATISYTLSTGCSRTTDVTVNVTPPAITGNNNVCVGATSALSNGITGGTWISSNTSVANVGYSTGIVTGTAAGVAVITYTLVSGCKANMAVTVLPIPAAITGTAVVCEGGTTSLTNTTVGGTWSSSNTSVATIGSGSGIVVGFAAGTTEITYTILTSGCQRTRILTVNALPASITGLTNVCVGSTTTLSSTTLGGNWSSANTAIATVNPTNGVVTGVSNGTVTITYTLATGCRTTQVINVNPLPPAITGTASLCVGATTVLSNSAGGGTWSSSNPVIGTVDVTSGVVTGMSQGNALITYTLGTTCRTTRAITVNPMPSAIMGTLSVCEGLTTNLSDLTPGGSWTSSNPFVATVGGVNGIVNGATPGIATIAYTLGSTGCRATADVTVNAVPYAISGTTNICIGLTSALSSLSTGGTWSSSNTLIATVDASTGLLTGIAVGTARITYVIGTGCKTTTVITVSPQPASISGVAAVCQGSTTTLASTTTGGNWVTSDFGIASVTAAGVVTGVAPGTANISYVLSTGCMRTVTVTVNETPVAIAGTTTLCRGASTTLTDATAGGNWSSSNAAVATISTSGGLLTAVNPGTSMITYSLPTGCKTFAVISVNPLPAMITGATLLCEGSTSQLNNAVSGGTWSSVFTFIATVDVSTGLVSGSSSGIDTIKYTLAGGCSTAIVITVNPAPPTITGDSNICVGFVAHLANATSGGTWSSSDPSVASVGLGDGTLTGISAGTSYITYTLGAGCRVVGSVTVNPAPATILGPNVVCAGLAITLTNAVAGGTWTSDDPSVASVVSTTGVVTGTNSGVDTIRYTLAGGCSSKFGVTVNPTPVPIDNQPLTVCQGLTMTLTDVSAGGIWTSSDAAIAPITPTPSSNMVLGVAPGTVTISYTFPATGCATSAILTVYPTPDVITGNMTVCEGSTTLLSTTSIGGTWTSSAPAVASVGSSTGIVIGFGAGIATITYTMPTGCITTALVVVNPSPAAIAGATTICVGSSTIFTNATSFGTWSSSNTTVASVGSASGEVTGLVAGTTTITYKLVSTGCYVTQQVTINPLPPPVLGNAFVCVGAYTTLTNAAAPGGTWTSSNPAVGTVDVSGGNVTGLTAGTTNITYTLLTACYVSTTVTVEALPAPIGGTANVCENATITLTDAYPGGVWSSSNPAVGSVDAVTGVVTGVVAGPVVISYSTPVAHCAVTTALTVDPVPVAILGADHLCEGTATTYFDGTSGGTWTSSDIAVATIGSTTGDLAAISPNTVTISYTIGNGCSATKIVTVDPLAHAGTIVGPTVVCENTIITLTNPTSIPATGAWSSSNTAAAVIDGTTGAVTGVAAGTTLITYIATNNCSADTTTFAMTVNPAPHAGTVSGGLSLCKDYTSTLTSTITGGVWTSSNTGVATVGSASGVVTAIVPGTAAISYAVTNSCGTDYAVVIVTVNLVAPHTSISIHPDSVLCMNTLYQNFGTDSAQPSGLIYTWTAVNAEVYATSTDKQNAIVNFPNSGLATVKLLTQIASTGCFVTDSFNVNVGTGATHTPEVQYYASELVCTDNTADTYQWGYDDKATLDSNLLMAPGFNQQACYVPVPDFTNKSYWVISSHGGCYQKTYYNPPTSVITVTTEFDIHIFPNPADAMVNIEVTGGNFSDNITATVIDMLGKEVATTKLVNGKCGFNVYNMPAGVYSIMFVADGAKIGARTFVKK